LHLVKNF